jgi:hypothetical protein
VAWREKYFPLQIWSKRIKKYSWMKNLNGLTFQLSEYPAFEDWWIALLRESRVNRLVVLENSGELMTFDGYGLQSIESLEKSDPEFCSLRKCPDSKNTDSPSCYETLPKSGMMRRGIVSERPTWKPRTKKEKESLSLHDWPTATVNGNNNRKGLTPNSGDGLSTAVKNWRTPTTRDYKDVGNMTNVPENCLLGRRVARTEFGLRETANLNMDGNLHERSTSRISNPVIKTGSFLLNPRWVETLMGIPVGWTNSDYAEMESYLQWRGLHGTFLKLFLLKMGYGDKCE